VGALAISDDIYAFAKQHVGSRVIEDALLTLLAQCIRINVLVVSAILRVLVLTV
jgi:hypothetical protein